MREIPVSEVRAGDSARSNGKEFRVVDVRASVNLIRCEGGGPLVFKWPLRELEALGVTFWREDRAFPSYPGAVVASRDGLRCAVRACDRGENFAPWLTTGRGRQWRTDSELLEWLGPNWEETTTPPAREWVPVDVGQVREGDFMRFEWSDGDAVEGVVTVTGSYIEFEEFDVVVTLVERGKWFKREEQTGASE